MTRGEDGETVAEMTVPVDVTIRAWGEGEEQRFDWISTAAVECGDMYNTIEEAAQAARDWLGG